jgi:predicted TIM-barrel fold metal-dependent hydrolase
MMDIHVHLAALPDGSNGCYISPKMLNGLLFRMLLIKLGLPADDPARANEIYIQKLVALLREAKFVNHAMLLGMDGVYDSEGVLNKEATHFTVCNDYVLAVAKRFPEHFRAGVSINPQRRDALAELHRVAMMGAGLVKVLPNSQQFDPANPAFKPFWRAMADLKIPLLCHVGYEFSLWGQDQSVGDPGRLQNALEAGVKVIAAHGASFGLFVYEKYWGTLCEYVRRYPNFYWDASALSLPNRVGMLLRLRRHPELHNRMVFGTDYPLTCFAYPALLAGKPIEWLKLRRVKNPFDRHYQLLSTLGFEMGEVFR